MAIKAYTSSALSIFERLNATMRGNEASGEHETFASFLKVALAKAPKRSGVVWRVCSQTEHRPEFFVPGSENEDLRPSYDVDFFMSMSKTMNGLKGFASESGTKGTLLQLTLKAPERHPQSAGTSWATWWEHFVGLDTAAPRATALATSRPSPSCRTKTRSCCPRASA